MIPRFFAATRAAALAAAVVLSSNSPAVAAPLTEQEAQKIAVDAYIYAYPLVTMEMTRRVTTNVAEPNGLHAPMGRFANARRYPDASFRDVTAPNADTLYSSAWLDLSAEPMVLSLPDMGDRYFLIPMLDAWTNVFQVPGKRTTGDGAQKYLITGPGWKGEVPAGLTELKAPTSLVWIIGRTYCTGAPEDYAAVHALQAKYELTPLSAYGKPYTPKPGVVDPSVDGKTAVRKQVGELPAAKFFEIAAQLMGPNPPAAADAPMVAEMAKIGITPGKPFHADALDPVVAKALAAAPALAAKKVEEQIKAAVPVNGWLVMTKTGVYGTEYLQRALTTVVGLGANRPQDAVYPFSELDPEGKPYSGDRSYVLHFPKGHTPPVNGFWSLTMYDENYFFVANPLNKYTVSPRNALKYNEDGSLDLYVSHASPGAEREANWLPAPQGRFKLMMRLYWPKEEAPSVIDGSWKPPAVQPTR